MVSFNAQSNMPSNIFSFPVPGKSQASQYEESNQNRMEDLDLNNNNIIHWNLNRLTG